MSENFAISVKNVSKSFRLPHERQGSVKNIFMSFFKGKKSYEKQEVLKDISFEIKKGEFFGIVGRNGSGKSTLLKLLAGIYSQDKGSIQVNGKLVPFIELGVGFNPELTGRENVFLNGALLGFDRKQMQAMYDEIVEFAGLKKFMDQKLKNYSSGMQVRLAFSIAIRADSDILVLDEVLAVGDEAFQRKCFDYFEELKTAHKTVVLVSHNMSAIKRFCSRAILLKEGTIIKEGKVYEVTDAYLLENIDQINESENESENKNFIQYSIIKKDQNDVTIKADYKTEHKSFASLSIWKEGILVGAISTQEKTPLTKSGSLTFTVNKKILNPGIYSIGGGLFRISSKSLLAAIPPVNRKSFLVDGEEKRRGGALKLEDTWKYD